MDPSPSWPRRAPTALASPEEIERLLMHVERLTHVLEKRMGQTDIHVIEAEERIKRHIDVVISKMPGRE